MILIIYAVIGLLALLLIAVSRSKRTMNFVTIGHTFSYLLLSAGILISRKIPLFFTRGRFFLIDNFALYEVIIASFIFLLAAVYLRGYIWSLIKLKEISQRNIQLFYLSFSLLFIATTFAFFSNNLALFWIFLELTTLFSAILITLLNAKENIIAAIQYLFIVSPAMLFSFIGLILLYAATQFAGTPTLNWFDIMKISGVLQKHVLEASFIFVFIGFAAKSGVVPFHNWLPAAHSRAPSPVSVLLSGVIINIGVYGIIRMFAIIGQTDALRNISWFLIISGLISVGIASFAMLGQKNVKRIIAFSSIEQVGIILIGIGIATKTSLFWCLIYIALHSITKSLLFFSAGVLNCQYGSNELDSVKDLIKLQPVASLGLIIGTLAILGLPPFLLFVPKFLLLTQLGKFSLVILVILLFFILVAGSGLAKLMTRLFSNVTHDATQMKIERYQLPAGMKIPILILIVLVVVLGLYLPSELQHFVSDIIAQLGF